MPTHSQGTVESPVTNRSLGKSATNDLKAAYSASPVYNDMTPDSVRDDFQSTVMDAVINDEGHTFGTFDTGYAEAPNLADVATGGGGLPASPYVPNPSSPGPGSMNPTDQPEAPDGFGESANSQWGSGVGSQLQPSEASVKISGQKLGDYVMGKSTKE